MSAGSPVVAVAGCGRWGTNIVRDLMSLGCSVIAVEPDSERRARADAAGVTRAVPTLADCGGAVDGAVVAVPTNLHAAVTMNSTSIIDEKHRGTYTPYGFILKVPAANVAAASTKDLAIANQSSDIEGETESKHAEHGLPSPGKILGGTTSKYKTGSLPYNEVVVRGRTGAGIVKVTGIFVKTQSGERMKPYITGTDKKAKDAYIDDALMDLLKKTAAELDVPIVYIDEEDPSQDKLETYDKKKGE